MFKRLLGRSRAFLLALVCVSSLALNLLFVLNRQSNRVPSPLVSLIDSGVDDLYSEALSREGLDLISQQERSVYDAAKLPTFDNDEKKPWSVATEGPKNGSETKVEPQTDSGKTPDTQIFNSSICVPCPRDPPGLIGPLRDMTEDKTPEELIATFTEMEKGGRCRPSNCVARQRLAIVIPYRNRFPHLHVLLHNLIPFLLRQQADFTVFVIEQAPPDTFNRGMLLNVGFLEAEKLGEFDCYIFHDVDLVPLDDRHMYRCGDNPIHFAVAMNKFKFGMPYKTYFGGIVGFSRNQFLNINGGSNIYFGWGGEDDDLRERVTNKGYKIVRNPKLIAKYDMIKHKRDSGNEANPTRKKVLKSAKKRQDIEGLSTASYKVNTIKFEPLYTWINVSVNMTEVLLAAPDYVLAAMRKGKNTTRVD